MPTPSASAPIGWREHVVDESSIAIALPPDWVAFDDDDLADPAVRADLEDGFTGAPGLFRAVDAQGSRVRLVFIGVDGTARGQPGLAPAVAVVAVEPRIPRIGLGVGADFVLSALGDALAIESEIERLSVDLPIGDAVRFGFDHRIVEAAGDAGVRARIDGALVTTDASSFLVLRNVDPGDADRPPDFDAILAGLRVLP